MYGHRYSAEQDAFIVANSSSIKKCVAEFNQKFGTNLSYSAIKSHANRTLKVTSALRPWTTEMDICIGELLKQHPYKEATALFNEKYGMSLTVRQVQDHCVRAGIKRNHSGIMKRVDAIIQDNIDKPYSEIREIVNSRLQLNYLSDTTVCRRANELGLNRPHRVWNNRDDKRTINGEEVSFSEYVRFIGNRWHRLDKRLQPIALKIVQLQTLVDERIRE